MKKEEHKQKTDASDSNSRQKPTVMYSPKEIRICLLDRRRRKPVGLLKNTIDLPVQPLIVAVRPTEMHIRGRSIPLPFQVFILYGL